MTRAKVMVRCDMPGTDWEDWTGEFRSIAESERHMDAFFFDGPPEGAVYGLFVMRKATKHWRLLKEFGRC